MEYGNKFVGLSSVTSHDLEILRYELEYGWKLAIMPNDVWIVTRGDGTQRIEVLYECYDKIEWFDFDELK